MEFEDENLSHCLSKDLTLGTFSNVLEPLRIDADYVSTVQRQTKTTSVTDYIKFLFHLNMSRLIKIGTFHCPDFSGEFSVFAGVRASLKNVIRISELSCLSVCDLE